VTAVLVAVNLVDHAVVLLMMMSIRLRSHLFLLQLTLSLRVGIAAAAVVVLRALLVMCSHVGSLVFSDVDVEREVLLVLAVVDWCRIVSLVSRDLLLKLFA